MESTLNGDSFVPFVREFRAENGFELKIRPRMATKYDVNSARDKIALR